MSGSVSDDEDRLIWNRSGFHINQDGDIQSVLRSHKSELIGIISRPDTNAIRPIMTRVINELAEKFDLDQSDLYSQLKRVHGSEDVSRMLNWASESDGPTMLGGAFWVLNAMNRNRGKLQKRTMIPAGMINAAAREAAEREALARDLEARAARRNAEARNAAARNAARRNAEARNAAAAATNKNKVRAPLNFWLRANGVRVMSADIEDNKSYILLVTNFATNSDDAFLVKKIGDRLYKVGKYNTGRNNEILYERMVQELVEDAGVAELYKAPDSLQSGSGRKSRRNRRKSRKSRRNRK
jgi:hypothetical protein